MAKKKTPKRSLWATAEKQTGKPIGELEMDDLLALPPNTQTSDGRGGSQNISAQIDARLGRAIQEQFHSDNTPYKTPTDWLRDACYNWVLICQKKYFEGEKAPQWQRLLEIQRNSMLLAFRNQITEEANEFARQVIDMMYSSPEEAAASVQRQLFVLVDEDDYAAKTYLAALNKAGVHQKLSDHLGERAIKLISQ